MGRNPQKRWFRAMKKVYSTYEAKAKLSEILRQVRSGKTIQISNRGEPIAEVRPIERQADDWASRLRQLTEDGEIVRSDGHARRLTPVARRRGALKRFLAERDT